MSISRELIDAAKDALMECGKCFADSDTDRRHARLKAAIDAAERGAEVTDSTIGKIMDAIRTEMPCACGECMRLKDIFEKSIEAALAHAGSGKT